jgi:hypothetical protein
MDFIGRNSAALIHTYEFLGGAPTVLWISTGHTQPLICGRGSTSYRAIVSLLLGSLMHEVCELQGSTAQPSENSCQAEPMCRNR